MSRKLIIGCVAAGLVLCGLAGRAFLRENKVVPAAPVAVSLAMEWNRNEVAKTVSMLRQGDIVIRRGLGPDSYILAQMNGRDKTYSHCGIVMIEHGYPFVYHAIGGEDNPDARLRRDSAAFFFSPLHNTHIGVVSYDMADSEKERLQRIVRQYYAARPRFDMKFDLATDDRLYCSEFVYKAVNTATNDTGYIKPCFRAGRRMVGIDDLFLNTHARLVHSLKFK